MMAATDVKGESKRNLTPAHKKAMAQGRREAKIVNRYLSVIADQKPTRGRKRTKETIEARLGKIQEELVNASPVKSLRLTSEIKSLQDELKTFAKRDDKSEVEAEFVSIAKSFGERRQISKSTWKEFGVETEVLEKAGIA